MTEPVHIDPSPTADAGRDPLDDTASLPPAEKARRADGSGTGATPPDATPRGGGQAPVVVLPVDPTERYELDGVHARGGLGRVVRARDLRLGRTVAIKELLHRTAAGEARFVREALITARLEHPGIVPVHEAGRWPSGDPYYSMKLVSGRTLKELVQARAELDDRLALLPHVIAVAEAIGYAHREGVIHRDIKPSNVVVGDFGETVVVDWGLARDHAAGAGAPLGDEAGGDDPAAGNVMGTPAYMAPEQARGDEVDARADVFSLGALLYEVLVGVPLYRGGSPREVLGCALAGPPASTEEAGGKRGPLAEVPPDLLAILWKAIARRPDDRYGDAKALAEDLKRFQTGQLVTARKYSTRTLMWRWAQRHRVLVAAAAASLAAAAVIGAVSVERVVDERNGAERERAAAVEAERVATERASDLVFLQAETSTRRDPTAAVAWLKEYPAAGRHADRIAAILDEAEAQGVARYLWRDDDWIQGVGFLPDGRLASGGRTGALYLRDLESGALTVLGRQPSTRGYAAAVMELVASRDGRLIATAGEDGTVALWDPATGAHRDSPGQGDPIESLSFTDDGARLLAISLGAGTRVLDSATSQPIWTAAGRGDVAALRRDGREVVVVTRAGLVERVALPGGARTRVAALPDGGFRVVLSPDGATAVVHGVDGATRAIALGSGAVRQLGAPASKFGSLAVSPSGRLVASGGADATVRVYQLATGRETVLRGHEDSIYQVLFAADEEQLMSASDDGTIRVWDLRAGGARVLRGHEDDVYRVALSADGAWLASAGLDATLRVWPLHGASERPRVGGHGELAALFFADDGRLITVDRTHRVARWDLAAGIEVARSLPRDAAHPAPPLVSPDGRWAVQARDGVAPELIDLDDGTARVLAGDVVVGRIRNGGFTRDSRTLYALAQDGRVVVWDVATGRHRTLVAGGDALAIGVSPDGTRLGLAGPGWLAVHDATSGTKLAEAALDGPEDCRDLSPVAVVFSDDGRLVTATSRNGCFPLWNLVDNQVRQLAVGNHMLMQFDFSPDGRWLAASATNRMVRVWNTETGAGQSLAGHTDLIMGLAFSPDSKLLASASYDRTIRLWQVGSWRSRVLRGHSASVDGVAFGPTGRLVSGGRDGTVRTWDVSSAIDVTAEALRARMARLTSAVIDADGRVATVSPPPSPAAAPR